MDTITLTAKEAAERHDALLAKRAELDAEIEISRRTVIESAGREAEVRDAKMRAAGQKHLDNVAANSAAAEARRQGILMPTVSIQRGARLD